MGPHALSSLADGLPENQVPVIRSRRNGAWIPASVRFAEEVRELAAALSAYGLTARDAAAVVGGDDSDTLRAALSVLVAGAGLVLVDPALKEDDLWRVLESTGVVHAVASDQGQLSRILAIRPELPALDLVLLMSALPSDRKTPALLVSTALEVGAARLREDPECLSRSDADRGGAPACVLVGSQGESLPVSRRDLLSLTGRIAEELGLITATTVLVALPTGGIARIGAVSAALSRGAAILLCEAAGRPDAGLSDLAVDAVLLTVAGLETLHRAWLEDIEAMSWLKRRVTRWAIRHRGSHAARNWKHDLADAIALRDLRKGLGKQGATIIIIEDPPVLASAEAESFFKAVGVTLRHLPAPAVTPLAR